MPSRVSRHLELLTRVDCFDPWTLSGYCGLTLAPHNAHGVSLCWCSSLQCSAESHCAGCSLQEPAASVQVRRTQLSAPASVRMLFNGALVLFNGAKRTGTAPSSCTATAAQPATFTITCTRTCMQPDSFARSPFCSHLVLRCDNAYSLRTHCNDAYSLRTLCSALCSRGNQLCMNSSAQHGSAAEPSSEPCRDAGRKCQSQQPHRATRAQRAQTAPTRRCRWRPMHSWPMHSCIRPHASFQPGRRDAMAARHSSAAAEVFLPRVGMGGCTITLMSPLCNSPSRPLGITSPLPRIVTGTSGTCSHPHA
jgi:hypothetical protein